MTYLCFWNPAKVGKKVLLDLHHVFSAWSLKKKKKKKKKEKGRKKEQQKQNYTMFHLLVEMYAVICFDAVLESDGQMLCG